jgi:tetratricopeptide (TPR) repeat protein
MMRSMIASRRALPLALLCIVASGACLAFLPSGAQAAGDKPLSAAAMAEALFKEGKRLLKEGKVAEACRKLEGSYRIDPAPGTLLNLALCHEEEGKTATAWGELTESRELAKKAKRADRLKLAEDHIRELEPKLSRFVVAVPKEAAVKDMVVEVDAVPLDPGAWGTAIPIDPGEH